MNNYVWKRVIIPQHAIDPRAETAIAIEQFLYLDDNPCS